MAAAAAVARPLLLPGPALTLRRLFALLGEPESYAAIALTLGRVLLGFLLGTAAGVLLGALTGASRFADALPLAAARRGQGHARHVVHPAGAAVVFSRMVPVWIALLMVLPVVWAAVLEAVRETDPALLEMARAFRLPRRRQIREIYARRRCRRCWRRAPRRWALRGNPASRRRSSPCRAWRWAAICTARRVTLETADLFAWTLCVIVLSMLLERALVRLMRRIRP